jgi:hypothetical protein
MTQCNRVLKYNTYYEFIDFLEIREIYANTIRQNTYIHRI